MKVGLLLLAAGESSRFGRPKQLLPFRGRPLLRHHCEVAAAAGCFDPMVVVLGALAPRLQREVGPLPATVVVNRNWKSGMGSSIRRGLRACQGCDAIVIMLCDQPFVTKSLLRRLVAAWRQTSRGIVACRYGKTVGPPALFGAPYFGRLRSLPPSAGAKSLLLQHPGDVRSIPFPKGAVDIDTTADWKRIRKK